MHTRNFIFNLLLLLFTLSATAQNKQEQKIEDAQKVLQDFTAMKEDIPAELLKVTEGIIIVPKLINAGFVIGGKRGKGIAMIKQEDGSWSNPSFITITGGSIGFQAGIQSVDLVLIFKDKNTLLEIGNGSFTLGGDVAVAAGPVGRSATASTDYKMEAEVYSYSKSKGLFAGISISGSAIDIDAKANEAYYGKSISANEIFTGTPINESQIKEMKNSLDELDEIDI